MIKIIDRITASAVWDINGVMARLPYRREFPEPVKVQKIEKYQSILKRGAYKQDNCGLCEAFRFFGGLAFVAIGMSCKMNFYLVLLTMQGSSLWHGRRVLNV